MPESNFYLGRLFDSKTAKVTATPIEYNPADLTTHAVVTGMTGSGKTGLCISLLEEAALQGVPAIIIDPKGDLTNLLLHFPELAPQDFQPWIDPEMARRASKTLDQAADEAASAWRSGLKEWGIGPDRLQALQNAAQFAIFTPGSDAGIPVSVLSSLAAPDLDWETNREVLRERISSTVTALLGLVGLNDLDPIRSREHILLSNIFEFHWSEGNDLDLTELILQTQTPPFANLGAFPVDTFFPAKDRMELAMSLNNILAAPAFETWREGQSLDIKSLLFTEDGRPRHSIFYLAHLSDGERMFFVTLLLSAVETWMRTQSGSTSLRALLYMDEIYGYLPPTAVPPSKGPLLRMLKQARAFGLGLLLATQNPVDIDYKALSNTGTWFIGKLQTERDKNRLLDGLESAAGGIPRAAMDKLISSLGKRVFVMHNVHEKMPVLMQTRWVMNFLAGPLTRNQIPALNDLANAQASLPASRPPITASVSRTVPKPQPSVESLQPIAVASNQSSVTSVPVTNYQSPITDRKSQTQNPKSEGSLTKPPLPAGIREYYLPQNYSLPEAFQSAGRAMPAQAMIQGVMYRPSLLAAAQVRIMDRKYGVDSEVTKAALVNSLDRRGIVRWDEFTYAGPSLDKVETMPTPSARFGTIDSPLNDTKLMSALQKDFTDWAFRNSSVTARANLALKVYGGPDVSQAEFMTACAEQARAGRDAEISKKTSAIEKKIRSLEDKLGREERELREDESELQNRNIESGANLLELGAGLVGFGRKKSVTTQFTKHRLAQNAKAEVQESQEAIAQFKKDLNNLLRERDEVTAEINDRWGRVVNESSEVTINPKKTDVYVNIFGVAWMPYYVIQAGDETMELPAFGAE
ncbi:MAG: ATP-binding protein [Chloroflexi bacterium]|nr:ATP-binding protein [Chloroflexota bacterium]